MVRQREFMQATGATSLALAANDVAQGAAVRPEPLATPGEVSEYLGWPAAHWLARLRDRHAVQYSRFDERNESPREQTYDAVASFGEIVLPDLRRMLLRNRDQGRREALRVLSRMGPLGQRELLAAAGDPRGNLRAAAITALARHFPDCVDLAALLLAALDDDVPEVRASAVESLWCVRQEVKPILEKSLRHTDPIVRCIAARQILRIDPSPDYAQPRLIEFLNDEDLEVRWAAARDLFFHLPVHPGVVPVLVELAHADCLAAANYLPFAERAGRLALLTLLENKDVQLRAAAATALSEFACERETQSATQPARQLPDDEAEEIVLACRRAVNDSDLAVRIPAERVLRALKSRE